MENETIDLESGETWDWDAAQVRPGNPDAGATVVVRFAASEFDALAAAAEQAGRTVSQYAWDAILRTVADQRSGDTTR